MNQAINSAFCDAPDTKWKAFARRATYDDTDDTFAQNGLNEQMENELSIFRIFFFSPLDCDDRRHG